MTASGTRKPGAPHGTLAGRAAIVTGAASGIGRATADLFASEGALVLLADLDAGRGREAAAEITARGHRAIFQPVDVTLAADCARLVERARHDFGALDLLINSAGVIRRSSVLELEESDWDLVLNVNVKSIFLLAKHAIPLLAESGGGA